MMNWKECGRKWSGLIKSNISAFVWRVLEKPRKILVRVASLEAEILTRDLPNASTPTFGGSLTVRGYEHSARWCLLHAQGWKR
jgi:hypothetical protein